MPGVIPVDDDHFRDQCGLFGIFGHPEAARLAYLGLYALQHRGQESAGIAASEGTKIRVHKAMGLVNDIFDDQKLDALIGDRAIGHVRYSTAGDTIAANAQPILIDCHRGPIALAHNGNIVNATVLKQGLEAAGSIFQSTADTEVILHLYARSHRETLEDAIAASLSKVMGAFSLLFLTPEALVAARDPWGFRPLVIGKLEGAFIICSESCALDLIAAEFVREVEPGELVEVTPDGKIISHRPFGNHNPRPCIFEHVYFSRPDSVTGGRSVYEVRKQIGVELAREAPVEADIVIPVPDSGVPAAIGYAAESGIPFELGIIRSHYVGRTFIQPEDGARHADVKRKHNANRALVAGKRIVLIDDSIVRGTTSMKIVQMMRDAGAKEVHFRVASPPTENSCFYGVDTPERHKLLAARMDIQGMAEFIHADSLAFVSIDGLYRAVGEASRNDARPQHCDACFTGDYPTRLTDMEERESPAEPMLPVDKVA